MRKSPGRLSAIVIVALFWSAQPALAGAGNAQAGAKVFKKCKTCHVVTSGKHRVGPSLEGVFGRTAGTSQGYKFSNAMKAYGKSGVVWDAAALDIYLEKPRKVVKGTKMAFAGLKKAEDRADVIAYLRQFSP